MLYIHASACEYVTDVNILIDLVNAEVQRK